MFVSVNINIFSAIYNIISDISILCCMCGLTEHTYDDSGLIFLKLGCDTHVRALRSTPP